ncbi:hypothetical protein GCM10011507_34910 [Edaphobacter acidisoli]|uniref:Head-tail adaptor protein n=1 Tax=Edaphobacter acidisoli TaxID=2040573 RepID=A0A916S2D2_9BACT|nr:hypothetical protein GCM10011507_34910 [Edaphobacter acidisoli]
MIPPGSLRYQVSVQAQSTTQDSLGGQTETWATILTCMAAIETISQREAYQEGQFSAQVTHRVSMYWPGVSLVIQGGMRVLFGSRILLIQTPENVQERNRVLHLHCLEINGAQ